MKTKKIFLSITLAGLFFTLLMSFTQVQYSAYEPLPQDKWVAPASADKITNPVNSDANSIASGKRIYKMLCFVCHGPTGKGDGMGGTGLTPKPTDLTSAEVQSQSDGAIFWKIAEGRTPMAAYKTSIPEKKRWDLINYIRTLK